MARGVNKVILIGNLGNDPDVRFTATGGAVVNLSVATSEMWKDKNTGQPQEKTEWHRVVIFGKLAEIAQQYLRKGSKVYLEGKLQTRKWMSQDGQDRYSTEVVIDGFTGQLQMLDSRQDGMMNPGPAMTGPTIASAPVSNVSSMAQARPAVTPPQADQPQEKKPEPAKVFEDFDDDIPF